MSDVARLGSLSLSSCFAITLTCFKILKCIGWLFCCKWHCIIVRKSLKTRSYLGSFSCASLLYAQSSFLLKLIYPCTSQETHSRCFHQSHSSGQQKSVSLCVGGGGNIKNNMSPTCPPKIAHEIVTITLARNNFPLFPSFPLHLAISVFKKILWGDPCCETLNLGCFYRFTRENRVQGSDAFLGHFGRCRLAGPCCSSPRMTHCEVFFKSSSYHSSDMTSLRLRLRCSDAGGEIAAIVWFPKQGTEIRASVPGPPPDI